MNRALCLAALLAACRGDEVARPAPPSKPDPRLAAMFDVIGNEALVTAARAKLPAPVAGGVVAVDAPRGRSVELRYQRGMRDYPSDLVDPQADAARRAVTSCLENDAAAIQVDHLGSLTLSVRIDHAREPAAVQVTGANNLDACVERRLDVLPADGLFLAVLRVSAS